MWKFDDASLMVHIQYGLQYRISNRIPQAQNFTGEFCVKYVKRYILLIFEDFIQNIFLHAKNRIEIC
jgi:hypothetical protein